MSAVVGSMRLSRVEAAPNAGELLEGLFASVVLFVASGAIFPLLRRPHGEGTVQVTGGGSPETRIYAVAFALTAVLLFKFRRELFRSVTADRALWLLPALAFASVVWSGDRSRTLFAAASLSGAMLFGAYFALRFSVAQQLTILGFTLAIAMLMSAALIAVDPSLGIAPGMHAGAWQGIYAHKNLFGRLMALALAVFVLAIVYRPRTRPIAIPLAVVAGVFVVLSQSRTSWIAAAGILLFISARPLLRRVKVRTWMIAVGFASIVAALAWLAWSMRGSIVQPDTGAETLTGRTILWAVVVLKILKRPVLGYGYAAFWGGASGDYVDVWKLVGWAPPSAHDGFLDVALDIGLAGLGLFLWVCIRTCSRAIALQRRPELPPLEQVWPGTFAAFAILIHLTEGQFLQTSIYWMLFTAAAVSARPRPTTPGSEPPRMALQTEPAGFGQDGR